MKFLASHENTARGTSGFPIELYYVDRSHPRYEMPFHWHLEHEIMLVLSGSFSLSVDGKTKTLHKGDTAIISAGAVHGGVPDNCIYECLVFDTSRFMESSSALLHRKYCDFFDTDTLIYPFFEKGTCCSELICQMFEVMDKRQTGYDFLRSDLGGSYLVKFCMITPILSLIWLSAEMQRVPNKLKRY